jgi:hypothetical protein
MDNLHIFCDASLSKIQWAKMECCRQCQMGDSSNGKECSLEGARNCIGYRALLPKKS